MDIEKIKEGVALLKQAINILQSSSLEDLLGSLVAAKEILLTKYAPFKVGEKIRLAHTPIVDEDIRPGWLGSKHFLVKGATGIVRSSDVMPGGYFTFYVEFDSESWIDSRGNVHPTEQKYWYAFSENNLEHEKQ